MPLTVRLPKDTEAKLNELAGRERKSKSDIIKESLDLYFERYSSGKTPFELGKELFGRHGSNDGELAINSEAILKARFYAKKHS